MAIGLTGADVESFQENFYTGMMEAIAQNINMFEQSNGAIRLIDQRLKGDYSRRVVRRRIASPISRRDPTDTGAATDIAAGATADIGVKLKRTFGPVANTLDAWNEMLADAGGSIEALALDYGRVAGEEQRADQVNSSLRALQAALDNQADNKHTIAASGAMDTGGLIDGLAKFGDAASRVVAWVGHSTPFFSLVKDQTITLKTSGISDFALASATPLTLNRPFIVTDSDSLKITTGTGTAAVTNYYTLGLTADACRIINSRAMDLAMDDVTGLNNLVRRLQAEFDYNIELKGFAWDETNGGANPTDAAVATGSNWDKTGTDKKHLPGVIIQSR